MQRTLKEIVGGGRRCQYCDRPLRPDVEYVRVHGHLHEIPTAEQLVTIGQPAPPITHVKDAVLYNFREESVFRFGHSSTWDGRPCTETGFWTGGDRGQGWLEGDGVLFCNPECTTYFAVAAYKDGRRIESNSSEDVSLQQ